ncbi:hypothetical protein KFK09_020993 [Dendrobium nobile]|uniref:Uncharacterized protein n=1 Tax=Dendrobium nobile TaxID=94219 RepID=A0A8T3ANZ7_DENNO|nr:hypothetical protein KFK09_020993 [Dendrobium nobile]
MASLLFGFFASQASRDQDVPFVRSKFAPFASEVRTGARVSIVVAVRLHCFARGVRLHESLLRLLRSCSALLLRTRCPCPIGSSVISIGGKDGSSSSLPHFCSASLLRTRCKIAQEASRAPSFLFGFAPSTTFTLPVRSEVASFSIGNFTEEEKKNPASIHITELEFAMEAATI